MGMLIQLLSAVVGIGSLVCFIMVIIQMFKHDQQTMGIVCIVGIFCCFGGIVAFVYGWMNAAAWNIQNIMYIWTGCILAGIVLNILAMAFAEPIVIEQNF